MNGQAVALTLWDNFNHDWTDVFDGVLARRAYPMFVYGGAYSLIDIGAMQWVWNKLSATPPSNGTAAAGEGGGERARGARDDADDADEAERASSSSRGGGGSDRDDGLSQEEPGGREKLPRRRESLDRHLFLMDEFGVHAPWLNPKPSSDRFWESLMGWVRSLP
jgi:hypothetical protein